MRKADWLSWAKALVRACGDMDDCEEMRFYEEWPRDFLQEVPWEEWGGHDQRRL